MAELFTVCLSNGAKYPYRLVHSNRAKYIRIKLSQQGDLSVTVPSFTHTQSAHKFVQSKVNWIEKNLSKIKPQAPKALPRSLDLKLLNEEWSILYTEIKTHDNALLKCDEREGQTLELKGNQAQIKDIDHISDILNQWCRKKAKTIFNKMLQELAEIHGFHYHRLSIRTQKTRWGSCSSQKNINLNSKLLFMPEEVVKYVIIHELCHTVEMNHSSRFWTLVEECDQNYQRHKDQLRYLGATITI